MEEAKFLITVWKKNTSLLFRASQGAENHQLLIALLKCLAIPATQPATLYEHKYARKKAWHGTCFYILKESFYANEYSTR